MSRNQGTDAIAYTIGGEEQLRELKVEQCDLDFWITEVAGKLVAGDSVAEIPDYMLQDAPLRHSVIAEFAFQALAEDKATRALTQLIAVAPDTPTLEFYTSQLMDEARHRRLYRQHLVELGIPHEELDLVIGQYAGEAASLVLAPVERYGLEVMAEYGDFYRGVLIVTVLVEGVIAPITELSELKWRVLNPAAARVQLIANGDENRHLAVGSSVIRRHLSERPDRKQPLLDLVRAGRELWEAVPMADIQLVLEQLYQQGLEQHADVVGDYEIWKGRRLLDTTPEERVEVAQSWSRQIQDERLEYMLLSE